MQPFPQNSWPGDPLEAIEDPPEVQPEQQENASSSNAQLPMPVWVAVLDGHPAQDSPSESGRACGSC